MPVATQNAWLALYVGVGVMVALCGVLAALKTIYDLQSGRLVLKFRKPGRAERQRYRSSGGAGRSIT